MKTYYRGTALATAALIAGVSVSQPVSTEPHTHAGESAPVGLILHTGLSASGGFGNVSAGVISTSSSSVWVLPSTTSTFLRDVDFASRLRQVGITVYVQLAPADSSPA
jgi:hypothetical protein